MHILYPVDPVNPRLVDEEFRAEAQAARSAGLPVIRVNVDELERENGDPILPWPAPNEPVTALYRGWMLTPDLYSKMAELVQRKNVTLHTSPQQYQQSHELPGWVDEMRDYTAKTVELTATELAPMGECLEALAHGKVFLRDYSKSLKHNPEACVIEPGASSEDALTVARLFADLRGEYLAGHILLRSYEDYVGPEVRTWWRDGQLRLATPHPDTPEDLPAFLTEDASFLPSGFTEALGRLSLPFVTCDFALRADGQVRLIEVGDGQVSGVPAGWDLDSFAALVFA